jgi:flagellar biosynthesis GTPase FlhF
MTVRRFFAAKSHLVMNKVQRAMRKDMRILSVKKVDGGVEVLVEGDLANKSTIATQPMQQSKTTQTTDKTRARQ